MSYLNQLFHPERYHGHGRKPPFFEGWYFKLVDAAEQHRYAIIPGIFLSQDPAEHHSFIQVLDGLTGNATYHRYPASEFWAAEDDFLIRIGPNTFSANHLSLNIADEQRVVQGEVKLLNANPWPVSLLSPGIMGPFGWVPRMECNHGVVSLDHGLAGLLNIDGTAVDFSGGRGYTEKDWGAAFPAGYVWLQSNHFHKPGTSLVASIAIIPWGRRPFAGFIIGFWHKGKLHRFATYTGAKTEYLSIQDHQIDWTVGGRGKRLRMTALRAKGGLLYGPTREKMGDRIGETMLASVEVRLTAVGRLGERLLFAGCGRNAGLEVHGDLERLLALQTQ